ncbi:hypothetical protein CEXT_407581 [Caerostris extrusa]|uniref:Uncharacterized protein n=1 Tax=Caerostris extrusa TaxID=172846 RepID=A0AAV4QTP4_CAEEX|nr:hypothetical protein CEXT_407581 [Caerostris extrusa]
MYVIVIVRQVEIGVAVLVEDFVNSGAQFTIVAIFGTHSDESVVSCRFEKDDFKTKKNFGNDSRDCEGSMYSL